MQIVACLSLWLTPIARCRLCVPNILTHTYRCVQKRFGQRHLNQSNFILLNDRHLFECTHTHLKRARKRKNKRHWLQGKKTIHLHLYADARSNNTINHVQSHFFSLSFCASAATVVSSFMLLLPFGVIVLVFTLVYMVLCVHSFVSHVNIDLLSSIKYDRNMHTPKHTPLHDIILTRLCGFSILTLNQKEKERESGGKGDGRMRKRAILFSVARIEYVGANPIFFGFFLSLSLLLGHHNANYENICRWIFTNRFNELQKCTHEATHIWWSLRLKKLVNGKNRPHAKSIISITIHLCCLIIWNAWHSRRIVRSMAFQWWWVGGYYGVYVYSFIFGDDLTTLCILYTSSVFRIKKNEKFKPRHQFIKQTLLPFFCLCVCVCAENRKSKQATTKNQRHRHRRRRENGTETTISARRKMATWASSHAQHNRYEAKRQKEASSEKKRQQQQQRAKITVKRASSRARSRAREHVRKKFEELLHI